MVHKFYPEMNYLRQGLIDWETEEPLQKKPKSAEADKPRRPRKGEVRKAKNVDSQRMGPPPNALTPI